MNKYLVELVKTEYREILITAESYLDAEEKAIAVTDGDWVVVDVSEVSKEKNT